MTVTDKELVDDARSKFKSDAVDTTNEEEKTKYLHENGLLSFLIAAIHKNPLSDVDLLLICKTAEGYAEKYESEKHKTGNDKIVFDVAYELNIIVTMKFSDYFMVVQDFLDVGRRIGYMPESRIEYLSKNCYQMTTKEMNDYINEDQSMPGLTIGPGRGSAAGSKVAFCLGITSIDPVANDLLFERFLNPERVSMPDIDSDLSKSEFEYGVRDIVIEYVSKKYGKDGICGIAVPSTLAARAAVKNVARIEGERELANIEKTTGKKPENEKDITGKYLDLGARINKVIPADPKITFMGKYGKDDTDNRSVDDVLRTTFAEDPDALRIIDIAEKLEGTNINFGRHACGIIISDNGDIGSYAPLMHDPEGTGWKIQLNAEQAEAAGLLKMDFLGLKNLNIITKTARAIFKNKGIKLDLQNLPQDPEVYKKVFSYGLTDAVFQLESPGMKSMLKRFEPETFSDIVLLVACFRPGPMKYLKNIIDRKHGKQTAETAIDKIPQLTDIVAPTYGAIVYQEQVQQIFRKAAGYSLGQADNVRRAMGHKKMDILIAEKESFLHGDASRNIVGCEKNGIDVKLAEQLFEDMTDFAKYAFNKSHAAAYATTAYITAYLKLRYPAEFYASVFNFVDTSKFSDLINEAKKFNVEVKAPDIIHSENSFSGSENTIYFGFSGIKGIGTAMEGVDTKCASIADFILKNNVSASTIETLNRVGAFSCFCNNRNAISKVIPDFMAGKETINKKNKQLSIIYAELEDLNNGVPLDREKYKITTKNLPSKASLEKKVQAAKEAISEAEEQVRGVNVPVNMFVDNIDENIKNERDLLGTYISAHPLDPYGTAAMYNCTPLGDLYMSDEDVAANPKGIDTTVFGIITDYRIRNRKKDGAKLAFFTLEDQTGTVKVNCFTNQFEKYGDVLDNDVVVLLKGTLKVSDEKNSDESTYEFTIGKNNGVQIVRKKLSPYTVVVNGIDGWVKKDREIIYQFSNPNGHPILVYDTDTGKISRTRINVSENILEDHRLTFMN